jgi:hypothetical protein
MAFFTLTDIKFDNKKSTGMDAGAGFINNFKKNNRRFPEDLGNSDKGHYMMIYIFKQNKSKIASGEGDRTAAVLQNSSGTVGNINAAIRTGVEAGSDAFKVAGELFSKIAPKTNELAGGVLSKVIDNVVDTSAGTILNGLSSAGKDIINSPSFFRTIKSTKDSIALYMPNTLQFDYRQGYSDVSITENGGKALGLLQAGASILDQRKMGMTSAVENLSPFLAEGLSAMTGLGSIGFGVLSGGLAKNPQLEMIYQSPSFRDFNFNFMFYPRSQKEANSVLDIIDLLRFHQAPEVVGNSYGRYLVPPSEFDIQFHYNGKENPNIPKMSTCVLTGIQTNYAPNGFHAYEVPGRSAPESGGTGMPVGIQLTLSFKETEIVTKQSLTAEYNKRLGTSNENRLDSLGFGEFNNLTAASSAAEASIASDRVAGILRNDDGSYTQTYYENDGTATTLAYDTAGKLFPQSITTNPSEVSSFPYVPNNDSA